MEVLKPLVSIIIPVYKVEQYLRICIESVRVQTYTNWEMILVDDGSPDNCGAICDEYASLDDRIRVLHQKNGGQANARNHGLDLCAGKFVTFLDSDDFLHAEALEYLIGLLVKNDADIVQCGFIRGSDKSFPTIKRRWREMAYDNHSVFLSGKANIIVWGKLYKRDILDANRIKEGWFYEDDFTTWRWYYHAKKIVVSDRPLYYYTSNPTSTMAAHAKNPSFDFMQAYKERILFFEATKEKDLEHCSRLQFCKSLLLIYSNNGLAEEERRDVKTKFDENWHKLNHSPYIKIVYKLLFTAFHLIPLLTSKLAAKLR